MLNFLKSLSYYYRPNQAHSNKSMNILTFMLMPCVQFCNSTRIYRIFILLLYFFYIYLFAYQFIYYQFIYLHTNLFIYCIQIYLFAFQSYRNKSIYFQFKSSDWFLYAGNIGHNSLQSSPHFMQKPVRNISKWETQKEIFFFN